MQTIKPIISLGECVEKAIENGWKLSHWKELYSYCATLTFAHAEHFAVGNSTKEALENLELKLIQAEQNL